MDSTRCWTQEQHKSQFLTVRSGGPVACTTIQGLKDSARVDEKQIEIHNTVALVPGVNRSRRKMEQGD